LIYGERVALDLDTQCNDKHGRAKHRAKQNTSHELEV